MLNVKKMENFIDKKSIKARFAGFFMDALPYYYSSSKFLTVPLKTL